MDGIFELNHMLKAMGLFVSRILISKGLRRLCNYNDKILELLSISERIVSEWQNTCLFITKAGISGKVIDLDKIHKKISNILQSEEELFNKIIEAI